MTDTECDLDYSRWLLWWLITWGAIGEAVENPINPWDIWIGVTP